MKPTPPETLDELLAILPGLRYRRSINADWLRVLLDRKKRHCTWCGEPTGKRLYWCSDECVTEFKMRCSPSDQMAYVIDRDRGICQDCGRDTLAAERDYKAAWEKERNQYGSLYSQYRGPQKRLREKFGFGRGRFREVDHRIPVVLGGGLLGPDNLRLLCGACHATATRRLAAARRKGNENPKELLTWKRPS